MESSFIEEIKKITKNIDFKRSFKEILSMRCGGDILVYFTPKYLKELISVLRIIKKYNINYIIIGNGTNTICGDKFYNGVVISFKYFHLKYIEFDNKLFLFSNFNLSNLLSFKYYKYYNKLSYIPGCVGGSCITNPSFMEVSFYDVLLYILVYDITLDCFKIINKDNISYGYRYTNISSNYIIIGALIKKEIIDERYIKYDKVTNRINNSNSGSIFKNPINIKAWKLISQVRNRSINKCKISDIHYNIIVNDGSSGDDIYMLIYLIKDEVRKICGVDLDIEVHLKNFDL